MSYSRLGKRPLLRMVVWPLWGAGRFRQSQAFCSLCWRRGGATIRLAPDGGLRADQGAGSDRVYSRYWVTAAIGSAFTAGHFGKKEPQSNQRALAPPLGTSLRLGVPVIRQGFGGPPPRAIHGAGRLNRHPCRFTPQIPVEFRPAWFDGALKIKSRSRSRSRAARFASWLLLAAIKLCDGSVYIAPDVN